MSHSADHILALSVMRLANPTTEFQPSSLLDSCAAFSGPQPQQHGDASAGLSREVEGSFINELVSPGSSGAGCDFWLPSRTQALLLPVSAGRLFAGEVFQAYLHIVNKSAAPEGNPNARERERAHNVSVYVEMQVNDSSRYVLLNTASSPELVLLGGRYLDFTVTHLLSEPGNYTMACVITYDTGDEGAQKGHTLRKSFRFSVSSAFSLSHKIREMPVQTNERRKVRVDSALVEVCVENSSGVQVLLCDASLSLPAAGNQNAPPAGTLPAGGSGASSRRAFLVRHEKRDATAERGWSGVHFFKPGEKLRLVFRIEQDEGSGPPLKSLPHLGNVCLEWRSAVGGRGLSSEYLLKAMPLKGNPVEVRVSKCPSVVQVGRGGEEAAAGKGGECIRPLPIDLI
uniref:Trafficking protein particle complex subunit 13 N-terminal domain-containing protein n=1 Tax=Chromera velia CCMP2878 TaxID=1169474 RepID=A0A0G4HWX2_9ALVE|eukprot:Cvel_1450.t1-p1 / transcript=Cvel_1450.t1 / gene=Cvel_1450 / organism=Chromera_velia_CCMP2878 / gene_product=Probable trafficking protein particle complex, putative / transcript_product=Probable trafficking protein particle complex, putative / location=Cvel_scaffold51:308-4436(-) / protein_length=398 / sequence_SO=supercontig / SO=protein_coding / is_pseudo=false